MLLASIMNFKFNLLKKEGKIRSYFENVTNNFE
jgi:hypothetical protein